MATMIAPFILSVLLSAFTLIAFFLTLPRVDISETLVATAIKIQQLCMLSSSGQCNNNFSHMYGWQAMGHTHDEEIRLRDTSIAIAAWPPYASDNVPTVPCLSGDSHLLILSASASRVRYGTSITFIMIYPNDVKSVLPKGNLANPLSSDSLSLWCIFGDGSITPVYSSDFNDGNDRTSLLDCLLSPFATDELWRYNRTLRVYLASTMDKNQDALIAKAYVSVPESASVLPNSSQQLLTLCTSPLQSGAEFLTQWIQFHLLVGFHKFVVYNTTDTHQRLASIINDINRKYPNLVDVVQWNFSSLALTDVQSTQYFQTEALLDCLIRYGDQTEWLGMLGLNEYIVPMSPYTTVLQYLHVNFGRRIIGSVNLWSQFFCTEATDKYFTDENDTNHLVIERFTLRAPDRHRGGRKKYLYQPRFVHYLSLRHQKAGLSKQKTSQNSIMLANYVSMSGLQTVQGCSAGRHIQDASIRDRFAQAIRKAIQALTL